MNNFEKAYEDSHKNTALKDWWKKNRLTVLRIILFPLWIAEIVHYKIKEARSRKNVWSEERAEQFCNKYLPQICEKTECGFYLFNNGYGFSCFKCVRRNRKDRDFADVYKWQLFNFIKEQYEIEGYKKDVYPEDWDRLEVDFIKK